MARPNALSLSSWPALFAAAEAADTVAAGLASRTRRDFASCDGLAGRPARRRHPR